MKRLLLLVVCALASLPLFAAIKSIAPGSGTVTGGDTVTIVVDTSLYSCPVCSPPVYEADVTFDGVAARSVFAWNDTIYAVTPALHTHTFNVTVAVHSHGTDYGTGTFYYYGWGAENPDTRHYEKVLFPLALQGDAPIPGSFGTLWTSELWFSNPTQYPVELFNDITCTLYCQPPPPGGPFGFPSFGAGNLSKLYIVPTQAGNYGLIYYVQKTYANDVSFSLHVRDLSHSAENAGSEIGVVRAHDFRGAAFDILNVPIDTASRATLRVYDVNPSGYYVPANVAFYSMDTNQLIASTTLPVTLAVPKKNTSLANDFPPLAGVAQINDIRGSFAFIQGGFPSRVRVHVELGNGASQSWGFVTVTNNSTQLITTYRPE